MEKILLTNSDFVRVQTNISDNLTDKYLLPAIREAQDIYFQEIIGTCLYNRLCELVKTSEIEQAQYATYKGLLDKAQYYLAYQTISILCVNTTYKISNIGVNTTTDDNVQIPYMSEVMKLKDYYQNKADFYCLLLEQFIYNNRGSLKEIDECGCAKIHSHIYSSASCGLNLGGDRGKIRTCKCSKG